MALPDTFKGFNHGKEQIDLTHLSGSVFELRPVEIHLKENGSITDGPSFAIVMVDLEGTVCFGQLSLEMLNKGLQDIGYEIIKR